MKIHILIAAIKKNENFSNDLVKKLNGKTLIEYAMDHATQLVEAKNDFEFHPEITVVTDSEEIKLLAERRQFQVYFDAKIRFNSWGFEETLPLLNRLNQGSDSFLFIWPYCPFLGTEDLSNALQTFESQGQTSLISTKKMDVDYIIDDTPYLNPNQPSSLYLKRVRGFMLFNLDQMKRSSKMSPYILPDSTCEITSLEDWWSLERSLERKRIVFRVIGNNSIGMGHIYRAISLARELNDHEIIIACETEHRHFVNAIAGADYYILSSSREYLNQKIAALHPDLVINDILNTQAKDVLFLKELGISAVHFEDLGEGAPLADLTINEIYETPLWEHINTKWGYKYSFIRDEFNEAKPHLFQKKVDSVLISFGGSDPQNYTLQSLLAIWEICSEFNIKIDIITGPAFLHKQELMEKLEQINSSSILWCQGTTAISSYMEGSQLAICSNGRTTFELAHLNIPAIVIPQNAREEEHHFAQFEHGFLRLKGRHPDLSLQIKKSFKELVESTKLRKSLFDNMLVLDFIAQKQEVIALLNKILENSNYKKKFLEV